MTKNNEQIIIDSVDVSGCEFYGFSSWGNHICCPREFSKAGGCIYCNDKPNCHFKQLERLKEHHYKTEREASENLKKLAKLEQECEELKEKLQKYKDNEQQEKEMQKLYNKFNGNSLIKKV